MDDGDMTSLADSLLGKEEEVKTDEKPVEEDKSEEQTKPDTEVEETVEKPKEEEKSDDNGSESKDRTSDNDEATDEKVEGEPAKEDTTPLTRDEIKAALREEAEERAAVSSERTTFAGKVRDDLKEALKLDSTYTTVALDDGTPINSVSQLTQVINPETEEPYTREEAASLLLDAKKIVEDNTAAYEKRVDELTDLNVNFKEQSDRVDELYGDILKAFPEEAKGWLEAYKKTFKVSDDGTYVENVPISPLEFYGPILAPYRNATDQLNQQKADAMATEAKVAKDAEVKAEQEDRGDLGGAAGAKEGKADLLDTALDKYLKDN